MDDKDDNDNNNGADGGAGDAGDDGDDGVTSGDGNMRYSAVGKDRDLELHRDISSNSSSTTYSLHYLRQVSLSLSCLICEMGIIAPSRWC